MCASNDAHMHNRSPWQEQTHRRRWPRTNTFRCSRTLNKHTGVWCPSFHMWRSCSPALAHSFTHKLISRGKGGWCWWWSHCGHMTCCCCRNLCVCVWKREDVWICMFASLLLWGAGYIYFLCVCKSLPANSSSFFSDCFSIRVWSNTGITLGLSESLIKEHRLHISTRLAICYGVSTCREHLIGVKHEKLSRQESSVHK